MKQTKGIRWPADLKNLVEMAATEDERTFSDEVRVLVRLGLKRRKTGGAA